MPILSKETGIYSTLGASIVYLSKWKCKGVLVNGDFVICPDFVGVGDYLCAKNRNKPDFRLPTVREAQDIIGNIEEIERLLKEIHGVSLFGNGCWIDTGNDPSSFGKILVGNKILPCVKTRVEHFRAVCDYARR